MERITGARAIMAYAAIAFVATEFVDLMFMWHRVYVEREIARVEKWKELREQARREQREAAHNDRIR